MPTTNWNLTTINGIDYLVIDSAMFRIPLDWDPNSNMFLAVAAPSGGLGNFPALVKGDPGDSSTFSPTVLLTALEPTDPTPDSASLSEIATNVWQLSLALHKGAAGEDGAALLDTGDYGTPLYKRILQVDAATTGFEYTPQKVGDRYFPATIASVPSGNPGYTLASVAIPAQPFDWRPTVSGYTVVTGTGADVQVNLLARLDNATTGNIVGQGTQPAGQYPATHVLSSGPPAGSADTYDKVTANAAATVYMRTERQSGNDTYTTTGTTSYFCVRVDPIP